MGENMPGADVKRAELYAIISDFLDQGWRSLELTWGDYELQLRKAAPAPAAPVAAAPLPAPAAAPAAPATAPAAQPEVAEASPASTEDVVVVVAPMMGTFYLSPSPGADPFVTVGGTVAPGQSLCIVEVMKLMTRVECEVAGIVTAVHAENGQLVVEGDPLFTIAPSRS